MIQRSFCLILMLLTLATLSADAAATAFTYQGKLADSSGTPLSGSYDLTFRLFDAATGGNQVGSAIELAGTEVSGGLFTVKLDFGEGAFEGSTRWLEVSVQNVVLSPPD